jgi:LmbE family N-acetylglucosaminyl deacetylase
MTTQDVSQLGTILGIWAHPDDETFMVGGILSMAADNNQKVVCVTATKGESGTKDGSVSAELGETRANELAAALDILGITEHSWLGYQDGTCSDVPQNEAVSQLVNLIEQHKPDTIITFAPDGLTGHPDHQAVSRWAKTAADKSNIHPNVYFAVHTQELYDSFMKVVDDEFNVYFATENPVFPPEASCDMVVHLEPATAERKMQALKIMPSQYGAWFEFLGDKGVEFAVGSEALVRSK